MDDRAVLADLRARYLQMQALVESDPRARRAGMQALAHAHPGALRELDRMAHDARHARHNAVRDATSAAPWMRIIALYTQILRELLASRRTQPRTGRVRGARLSDVAIAATAQIIPVEEDIVRGVVMTDMRRDHPRQT
jgi:hypothetical protein